MPPVADNTSEPSMNATLDGRTNSKTDDDGGLSGGAVAGVVIVVIAVIAVAVIIVGIFLMRRKRAKAKPNKTQQRLQHTNSISNSMYMLAHHNVAGNRPDIIPSAPPQPEYSNMSVYNVPETADSSPIYSVPDDLDLPPTASRSPQKSTGYELSTTLQPSGTVADAGSMQHRTNGGKVSGLSAEACNKSGQSRYNELFLRGNGSQSGGRKSGDTYDHLNEENAREKVEAGTNSTAENEYSLAQDEHDTPHSHVYTNSNSLNQQENEYSLVYEENKPSLGCDKNEHSLAAQNNDDSSQQNNEYSLAQHPGSAGNAGNAQNVTENEYANFHNPPKNAAKNGTTKNDDYNRLDFEDAAYSSSQVPGEKMEYYNACEKNEKYDHLQNDQDCSKGSGEAVYRNLGFEENEYEI
ncbi:hypothetical protein V1264_003211 [Littorina saxatilis]|uniref:Uncharacterized protein n=2 Tax=Littorina saxatilis TaxID=31220 RepID=A0AAN9B5J4_9CAEN